MTTVFGKIIRGELPCKKVFENERIIAFWDIAPVAPVHILIVPKKEMKNLQAAQDEDAPLLGEIMIVARQIADALDVEEGYRLLTNVGPDAGQVVYHLHFHLIGGRRLGPLA